MSLGLLSIVWGVSVFIAMMFTALISLFIVTDSDWIFIWVGFPLSIILVVSWVINRWDYVSSFVTGRGGW